LKTNRNSSETNEKFESCVKNFFDTFKSCYLVHNLVLKFDYKCVEFSSHVSSQIQNGRYKCDEMIKLPIN